MIKLVFIIQALNNAGAETMLLNILQNIDRQQFEPIVISLTEEGSRGLEITQLGIALHTLHMPSHRLSFKGLRQLKTTLNQIQPHLIHGWGYQANFAASWGAHQLTKANLPAPKVIWNIRQTLYDIEYENFWNRLTLFLLKRSHQSAYRIIYNSECSAFQHEKIGFPANKRLILPNGFDTQHYAPNPEARATWRNSWQLEDDALVVTLCANFLPMKDHATFMQAVGQLMPRHRALHIVLVGDGIEASNTEFRKLIPLGMSTQRIHLQGAQADMAGIYAASDVFVLCSAWGEAFSNTIGEAMSCGLTGVVTDVGDAKTIVANTMTVVPPKQPILLADAIHQRLLQSAAEREEAGVAARQHVMQHYALEKIIHDYQDIYFQATN